MWRTRSRLRARSQARSLIRHLLAVRVASWKGRGEALEETVRRAFERWGFDAFSRLDVPRAARDALQHRFRTGSAAPLPDAGAWLPKPGNYVVHQPFGPSAPPDFALLRLSREGVCKTLFYEVKGARAPIVAFNDTSPFDPSKKRLIYHYYNVERRRTLLFCGGMALVPSPQRARVHAALELQRALMYKLRQLGQRVRSWLGTDAAQQWLVPHWRPRANFQGSVRWRLVPDDGGAPLRAVRGRLAWLLL